MKNKAVPYAAAALSSVIWGFSFLFTKNALTRLGMLQLLGYRFIVAAALMAVLAVVGLIKIRLTAEKLKYLLPVVVLEPVIYFICETLGVKYTSATESGIVIALIPIAVTLFSVIILKERLTLLKWLSVGICVAGVALIALANGDQAGSGQFLGFVALMGAVVSAGLYSPASRRASRHCTPMEITFFMMCAGAVAFTAAGIVADKGNVGAYFSGFGNPDAFAGIAYLGVLCSVVAFFCLNYALSKLEAAVVSTFANMVPIVSVFAGIVFGGEGMAPLQIAGAALILAGIWGASRGSAGSVKPPLPAQSE